MELGIGERMKESWLTGGDWGEDEEEGESLHERRLELRIGEMMEERWLTGRDWGEDEEEGEVN